MNSKIVNRRIVVYFVFVCTVLIDPVVEADKGQYGETGGCNSYCQQECIRVLNIYRANHDAQNLTYSQDLADKAQLWADGGQFGYDMSLRGKYGQLIEWDIKNELPSFTAVIKRWHDNEKEYNFRERKSNNGKTLHDFTQVVWKNAMHAGCGLGKLLGSRYYVVWMDADGLVSPSLGTGTENVGYPKQKDLNWFKDTLPTLRNNAFDENEKEDRNKLSKEEQAETIDDVAVDADENEEKVLNSKAKYKNTMQTESQFAHAHIQSLINPDEEAITQPPKIETSFSNIEKNHSLTAKYNMRERQDSELQQTDNHNEGIEKNSAQTDLEFGPTYPVEDQGNLYNKLISMSKENMKNKDEEEIQDVSSEVKSSYFGKTGQTNSELPQLISDPSEPEVRKESFQNVLSPDLDDMRDPVNSSAEELKLNSEPVISSVGEPMRSISAVGIPLSFFRKTNVSSFNSLNTNSSTTTTDISHKNVAVNEISTTNMNKSNEFLEQNDMEKNWNTISAIGKLNFSLKFPFKKNTSLESSDHLIQLNLSRSEPLKGTKERLSTSQSVNIDTPLTEIKGSNRRTSKLELNPPVPSSTTTVGNCRDVSEKCRLWAQHRKCKDITYMEYMRQNCKQTCGYCDYKNGCIDSKEHRFSCPVWSYHGYCEKRPKLMKLYCKKSCDLCGDPRSGLKSFKQHANKPRAWSRRMLKLRNPEFVPPVTLKSFGKNGSEKFQVKRKNEENSTGTGKSFSYKKGIRHGNFASANVNKVNRLLTFKTWAEKEKNHIKSILKNNNEDKGEATKSDSTQVSTSGFR